MEYPPPGHIIIAGRFLLAVFPDNYQEYTCKDAVDIVFFECLLFHSHKV